MKDSQEERGKQFSEWKLVSKSGKGEIGNRSASNVLKKKKSKIKTKKNTVNLGPLDGFLSPN